jgi:hypothetical protein
MGETASKVLEFEKLQKAKIMVGDGILFKNISQLLEYRREVAIKMDSVTDETVYEDFNFMYEYANQQLKELLAI